MKRTIVALAAAGFFPAMAFPGLAVANCGHLGAQAAGDNQQVAQGEQSTTVPAQPASSTTEAE